METAVNSPQLAAPVDDAKNFRDQGDDGAGHGRQKTIVA